MKRPSALLVIVLLSLGMAGLAQAQLIVVRPGYVRAPFVRVIRQPDGGTYVRAPFVRVNSGSRYGARTEIGIPVTRTNRRASTPGTTTAPRNATAPAPRPAERTISELTADELRQFVKSEREQFDAELTELPTGNVWRSYFESKKPYLDPQAKGPLQKKEAERVGQILQVFDKAGGNPDLRAITQTVTFERLQAGLFEFVAPPVNRLQRQLAISAARLQRELTRVRPSRQWQSYLAVSTSITGQGTSAPSTINIEALQKAIGRYDAVLRDPDDGAIRALPSFGETLQRLQALQRFINSPESAQRKVEEVPVPRRR